MPTQEECEATYHSGIGELLTAAYKREFTMQEKGRCKRKFPAFDDWYATLNAVQRQRVDKVLVAEYGEWGGIVSAADNNMLLAMIKRQSSTGKSKVSYRPIPRYAFC